MDLLLVVNQTFFMGFFFLLSGFFAPGAVDRRGPRAFAVERLKRLGIPLLGFVVLLRPLFVLPDHFGLPAASRPSRTRSARWPSAGRRSTAWRRC